MINCGLIGVGKFGKNILKNLKKHEAIKDIYLCDTNLQAISQFQNLPISNNYKLLLKNNDIQSIFIATPSNFHYNMVMDSINAGKHVFCEKPLCSTNNELLRIYENNKKCNKIIFCDYTFCHSNMITQIKNIIQLYNFYNHCNINISWKNTNFDTLQTETYIDVVRDLGVHCLSVLMFLFDSNDITITHVDKKYDNLIIIEATIYAKILNNNCIINISWDNSNKERSIQFFNDKQHLEVDFFKEKIILTNKQVNQVNQVNIIEKEEPLFNSISCFINSIQQDKNNFNLTHTILNKRIMYTVKKILDY
tara:strand:+ start:100 stop:1020 length:921 start_codon:yes stop_codon:yes gene_type:complete